MKPERSAREKPDEEEGNEGGDEESKPEGVHVHGHGATMLRGREAGVDSGALGGSGTHLDPPALQFFVPGRPVAQGSKRHVGRGIMVEMGKDIGLWRQAICMQAISEAKGLKLFDPIALRACFWFQRPKSHFRTGKHLGGIKDSAPTFRAAQPDLDKLLRALFDGLTASGVIQDDRQIVMVEAEKRYGDPGVLVSLQTL
jgi:Holliday junction resolvase RusA-like endonuclease